LEIKYFGQYFLQNYSNNDSGWYEGIAENGYPDKEEVSFESDMHAYAFFPLYPKIASVIKNIFGLDTRLSFFIITLLFSTTAFIVFFLFTLNYTKSETIAFYSTLVLMVFPHHYYFSMYYTECLFLLLTVLSFYFIQIKKWLAFVVVSSLLVLTRINGLIILLPLLLYYISTLGKFNFKLINNPGKFLPFLAMPLTFLLYCIYLKAATGEFLAFKKYAEAGWGEEPTFHSPHFITR
jgi:Gpi18-like mannosyltransferase